MFINFYVLIKIIKKNKDPELHRKNLNRMIIVYVAHIILFHYFAITLL